MIVRILIAGMLLVTVACAQPAEHVGVPAPSGKEVAVVNDLMAAFNDHDADKMRDFWRDDVTWIEISGERSSVVTASAEQLHAELITYFETYPLVSSSLENISVNGNYVTATEHAVWEIDGERKSQASIVVYEITDGKVARFWYFPPQ